MKRKLPMFLTTLAPDAPAEGGAEPVIDDGAPEVPENGETDEPKDESDAEVWDQDHALEKIRKTNAEAKALRERAKAAEAKASSADEANARADKAEAKLLRVEQAVKLGLPLELADRLQGNTPEEIAQDAEKLLALFTPKVPKGRPATALSGTANKTSPVEEMPEDLDKLASQMFRN